MHFVTKRRPNFWHLKGQKYFYGRFHLLTTKLRCLQKNKFGHTKEDFLYERGILILSLSFHDIKKHSD